MRRLLGCLAICAAPLLLGACVGNVHLSFLDAQGPVAAAQRWHFYWVLGIMALLVAGPIFLVLPFFVWRYRLGNRNSKYTPRWDFSRFLEIASWGGPIIIVGVLAYFVWTDSHKLDPYKPLVSNQPALHVQVIGYDWKWLFIYPDQGIATIGTLVLPAGRPVAMQLTSATVMQSFFIPSLGSQIYAMGGMVTQLHLEAARPGRFLGENTMYSGDGFHAQKFTAVAMSPRDFDAWARRVRAHGAPLDAPLAKAIARRDTRDELLADLPPGAAFDGNVYLTGVSPAVFPAVVRATQDGGAVAPPLLPPGAPAAPDQRTSRAEALR
ncbi:MAG TPA: ubiquinol oxidase subunit II [Rhodanobacteraceae bacterium]|nr:ubiquinol oxidase subunit II [Rhodanobacteraceae bacterium]